MIIKYTLKDNDFTQVIEKYLENGNPFLALNFSSYDNFKDFLALIKQYDNYNDKYNEEKEITKEEYNKIKFQLHNILMINFAKYITDIKPNNNWSTDGFNAQELQEDKDYILKNIKISIIKSIPDQWENGEVVYYITSSNNYIVM